MNEVRQLIKFLIKFFLFIYLCVLIISILIILFSLCIIILYLYLIYLRCYFLYIYHCFEFWSFGDTSFIYGIKANSFRIYSPSLNSYLQNSIFINLLLVYIITFMFFIIVLLFFILYEELNKFLFITFVFIPFFIIPIYLFFFDYECSYEMLMFLYDIVINSYSIKNTFPKKFNLCMLYYFCIFPLNIFFIKKIFLIFNKEEKPKFLIKMSEHSWIKKFRVLTVVKSVYYFICIFQYFIIFCLMLLGL